MTKTLSVLLAFVAIVTGLILLRYVLPLSSSMFHKSFACGVHESGDVFVETAADLFGSNLLIAPMPRAVFFQHDGLVVSPGVMSYAVNWKDVRAIIIDLREKPRKNYLSISTTHRQYSLGRLSDDCVTIVQRAGLNELSERLQFQPNVIDGGAPGMESMGGRVDGSESID